MGFGTGIVPVAWHIRIFCHENFSRKTEGFLHKEIIDSAFQRGVSGGRSFFAAGPSLVFEEGCGFTLQNRNLIGLGLQNKIRSGCMELWESLS